MRDVAAFVAARLDEDELIARAATEDGDGTWAIDDHPLEDGRRIEGRDITIYDEGGHSHAQAVHITRHDPARAFRQVAAGRQILAEYEGAHAVGGDDDEYAGGVGMALHALAAIWSEHPDYDPAWAPAG